MKKSILSKWEAIVDIQPEALGPSPIDTLTFDSGDVVFEEFQSHGLTVSRTSIMSEEAARALDSQPGQHIKIMTGPLEDDRQMEDICACLKEQLHALLSPFFGKTLCICGIGNGEIESDSVGPETAKRISPFFLDAALSEHSFAKIGVICPGTKGRTNLDTDTIVSGIASAINADCVLMIDATICGSNETLCKSIQLSDSGLRSHCQHVSLQASSIGVPTIAVGVPTVMDTVDLSPLSKERSGSFLTAASIKDVVKNAATTIASAVLQVAYPELDYDSSQTAILAAL